MASHERVQSLEYRNATAYINAGGRGTRLNGIFTPDPEFGIAKALLEVGKPPITLLDHHVAKMAQAAFRNIIVNGGDLECVKEYATSIYCTGEVAVTGSSERVGNGGDLLLAVRQHPNLFADRILVTNVDTILDIDANDFLSSHEGSGAAVSIALTRNTGVPNFNAFYVDDQNKVVYSKEARVNTRTIEQADVMTSWRGSSTGAVIINTEFAKEFDWEPQGSEEFSLYRHIIAEALREDAMAAYDNGKNFFLDVGTVDTWIDATESGVLQEHLCYDGVTNKDKRVA